MGSNLLVKMFKCALMVLVMTIGPLSMALGSDSATTAAATGEQLFRIGIFHFEQKQYLLAIEDLTQSLNQGYQTADVYRIRSNAYLKLKQYESFKG